MDHGPFTFFGSLFHVDHHVMHIVTAVFVCVLLVLGVFVVYPRVRSATANVVPTRKLGLGNIFEIFIEAMAKLCEDIIGPHGRKYLPFVGTVFFYILVCNLIGLIPGFLPATEHWSTGAAVAIIVFVAYNYFGFQEHGWGYVKHYMAPLSLSGVKNVALSIVLLIPLIAFQALFASIELVSGLFRPVTLSIRLFVNINADHLVGQVFTGIFPFLLPIPFLILGLLVSFIQAFIFTLLTIVYISLAVAHEH